MQQSIFRYKWSLALLSLFFSLVCLWMALSTYHDPLSGYETYVNPTHDRWSGFASFFGSVGIFTMLLMPNRYVDWIRIQTFSKRWQIWVYLNVILALNWKSMMFYFAYHFNRGDYPPDGDSMIIPIMAITIDLVIVGMLMNILIFFSLLKAKLPSPLFQTSIPKQLEWKQLNWLFYACFLYQSLCILVYIESGDFFAIPLAMLMTFGLLQCRSALFSKFQPPIGTKVPESIPNSVNN